MAKNILRIDASARRIGSMSRALTDHLVQRSSTPTTTVTCRDLTDALPQIDETWVGANFTPVDGRRGEQRKVLALSDALVAEIKAADTIIIGTPIYNF